VLQALLRDLDFPLAAPSANPFGYVSPTKAEHVAATLGRKIGAILDGGPCIHGLESTVVDMREPENPKILRPGTSHGSAIEALLGVSIQKRAHIGSDAVAQTSPGQLSKHYSPRARVMILANGTAGYVPKEDEVLILNKRPERVGNDRIFWLSEDGLVETIARNFFDLMQRLDRRGIKKLVIEAAPSEGIGLAFNDRLHRAAAK
jgi:L-threonylcarbamoyladenylate synthase